MAGSQITSPRGGSGAAHCCPCFRANAYGYICVFRQPLHVVVHTPLGGGCFACCEPESPAMRMCMQGFLRGMHAHALRIRKCSQRAPAPQTQPAVMGGAQVLLDRPLLVRAEGHCGQRVQHGALAVAEHARRRVARRHHPGPARPPARTLVDLVHALRPGAPVCGSRARSRAFMRRVWDVAVTSVHVASWRLRAG